MDPDRYRELFAEEAQGLLQGVHHSLVVLERAPGDEPTLRELYRLMHTLKGMTATMGYQRTANFCHALESVLDRLLDGSLSLTTELMDLLSMAADRLERLTAAAADDDEHWDGEGESLLEAIVRVVETPSAAPAPRDDAAPRTDVGAAAASSRATGVRINVKRLDSLINLTGELLIVKSRLRTLGAALHAPALEEAVDQLGRVSDSLQREVLQARMLPIGSVFDRFSRTVRDLARESGKQVKLVIISGQEIELDRTILDDISEPLIHLLRNAVSYGIEPPGERARLGKPETGTITLSGSREADRVVLEVYDDGRGIDLDEVRAVAVRKGFASAERAPAFSPQEVIALLFQPGFSTATAVTEVSGRGVGLNVVKTRVEALRGSIEVKSTPGEGTRFILRFPPTLAILDALLVRVGEDMFAIPMGDVAEVLEIDRAEFRTRNTLVLRRKAIALVDLAGVLGLGSGAGREGRAFVLVSSQQDGALGFVVDQVAGQQEIVIKPVERLLNQLPGVSGATILGDGRVVLILDLHALVRDGGSGAASRRNPLAAPAASTSAADRRTA